jgi:hypothetical protein
MADIFEMKSSHILYSNYLYQPAWHADATAPSPKPDQVTYLVGFA